MPDGTMVDHDHKRIPNAPRPESFEGIDPSPWWIVGLVVVVVIVVVTAPGAAPVLVPALVAVYEDL